MPSRSCVWHSTRVLGLRAADTVSALQALGYACAV